jgi:hypothetical protein
MSEDGGRIRRCRGCGPSVIAADHAMSLEPTGIGELVLVWCPLSANPTGPGTHAVAWKHGRMRAMSGRSRAQTIEQRIRNNLQPRLGSTAAECHVQVWRSQVLLGNVLFLAAIVGVGSAIAHSVPAVVVAFLLFLVDAGFFIRRQVYRHHFFRAVTEQLGVKVDWVHPVPLGQRGFGLSPKFDEWCERRGVARTRPSDEKSE